MTTTCHDYTDSPITVNVSVKTTGADDAWVNSYGSSPPSRAEIEAFAQSPSTIGSNNAGFSMEFSPDPCCINVPNPTNSETCDIKYVRASGDIDPSDWWFVDLYLSISNSPFSVGTGFNTPQTEIKIKEHFSVFDPPPEGETPPYYYDYGVVVQVQSGGTYYLVSQDPKIENPVPPAT